jgi:hypothetical protein
VITLFLFEEILSHSVRGVYVLTFHTDYKLHLYVTMPVAGEGGISCFSEKEQETREI